MFIVDDDRSFVLNVDNIDIITQESNAIMAIVNHSRYCLGRYASSDRAQEVWRDMLATLFPNPLPEMNPPESTIKMDNGILSCTVTEGPVHFIDATATYYMPEN